MAVSRPLSACLAKAQTPLADDSLALRLAAKYGHMEIARLLLPASDPKANDSEALRLAAENGHLEIVKLLLPVSNSKACGPHTLQQAAIQGRLEIVRLLAPFCNPGKALGDQQFIGTAGCDLLVSCLTPSLARRFVEDHPALTLPRTHAMLAADGLRHRPARALCCAGKRLRA